MIRLTLSLALFVAVGCVAHVGDEYGDPGTRTESSALSDDDGCEDKSSPVVGLCVGGTVCRTGRLQYVLPNADGACPAGSRAIQVSDKNMRALGYLMSGNPPPCDAGCKPVLGRNGEEVELRRFELSFWGRTCGTYWKTRECVPDPAADAGVDDAGAEDADAGAEEPASAFDEW